MAKNFPLDRLWEKRPRDQARLAALRSFVEIEHSLTWSWEGRNLVRGGDHDANFSDAPHGV